MTMGIRSDTVVSRVAKKTYGMEVCVLFQCGVHPEKIKFFNEFGTAYCYNIFDIFVRKGDEVRFDEVTHSISLNNTDQVDMKIEIIASNDQNPKYVIGDSVSQKNSAFTISFPSCQQLGFWPAVEVSMYFGRTEIQVTAIGTNFNSEEEDASCQV